MNPYATRTKEGGHASAVFLGHPANAAETVLKLSLTGKQRAIDRLLDVVASHADGPPGGAESSGDVFGDLLGGERWPDGLPMPGRIAQLGATLEALNALKASSKRSASDADNADQRVRAAARYVFAVASAFAFHGKKITSAEVPDMLCVMDDLAALTQSPWREIFARAADVCVSMLERRSVESDHV